MIQAIANIVSNSLGPTQIKSGWWECKEKADAEVRHMVVNALPSCESFRVAFTYSRKGDEL